MVLAVCLGALLVGCDRENDDAVASDPAGETQSDEPASETATETATEDAADELPSWAPEIVTDADGGVTGLDFSGIDPVSDELLVAEVTTGDGAPVEAGQTITADYFGQLPDADAPFDESFSSAPFSMAIGVGQLIPGWDQGLVGVPVGSRVIMSIPSDLGYGDAGAGDAIPGGATLFFVVDILDAS
ncbi:hypothetical protein BH09ACT12_BH09ACT12_36460 [soil metagenome]